MKPTICTYLGHEFDVVNPENSVICIEDIAHALALQARFNGHTYAFYSVAQHSCLVTDNCNDEYSKIALLHDAPEAYLGDIPSPIKQLLGGYKELELRVSRALSHHFDLDLVHIPKEVKEADKKVLAWEQRDLMNEKSRSWWPQQYCDFVATKRRIIPWNPENAEQTFLKIWNYL